MSCLMGQVTWVHLGGFNRLWKIFARKFEGNAKLGIIISSEGPRYDEIPVVDSSG